MKLLTNLIFEPKGMHNPALPYSIKDTVMAPDGSKVYFALQDVPAGVELEDEQYWKKQIDLSASKAALDAAAARTSLRVQGEIASASGNPASFLADAGSLLMPVTTFEPRQAGSGNPYPAGRGKNLCPEYSYMNVSWANNKPELVELLNSLPSGEYVLSATFTAINIPAATDMYGINVYYKNVATGVGTRNQWGTTAAGYEKQAAVVVDTSREIEYVYLYGCGNNDSGSTGLASVNHFQVEAGSAPTEFMPYANIRPISGWDKLKLAHHGSKQENTPIVHTVQIGETIYGGRLDWTAGMLSSEWAMVTADGSKPFTLGHTSSAAPFFECGLLDGALPIANGGTCISDTFADARPNTARALRVFASGYATADEFNAALAARPATFVYKLASPIQIQLTPTIITAAEPEQQNVLTGDGSIQVNYVKPLHVSIEEHVAAALAKR